MGCGASKAAIAPEQQELTSIKDDSSPQQSPHQTDKEHNNIASETLQVQLSTASASAQSQPSPPHHHHSHHDNNNSSDHLQPTSAQPIGSTTSTSSTASSSSRPSSLSVPHHRPTLSHTEDRFTILKVLGEGASCKVVSVRDKQSGHHYAMKIMDKNEPYNGVLFENESHILRSLHHPNILSFVDAYEDKSTYHLLTILCQGGELFDRVKNGSFSEAIAASLVRQMLNALAYCHEHQIVHRDLKPENFVFVNREEDSDMKLIDFGCAKLVHDDEVISDVAGSPYYCAPEILTDHIVRTGGVWKAADMWSVGVIIFLLVCGFPPFNGDSQEKIFKKIKKGRFRFPKPNELSGGISLSDSVQDLITKLLQMQPHQRLTASQALAHPWIAGTAASSTPLPSVVIDALNSFRAQCRLKKAAARVLLNKMTEDDRANLKAVFSTFDENGDGQLGPEEVTRLMHSIGKTDTDAKMLLAAMDDDGDGGVSLGEFEQAAALGQLNTEEEIKRSFDMFDLDHDGFITHMEIERVCGFLTKDTVISMLREVDANGDGRITFDEWLRAMTGISNLQQTQQERMIKKRESMQLSEKEQKKVLTTKTTHHTNTNNTKPTPVIEEDKETEAQSPSSAAGKTLITAAA